MTAERVDKGYRTALEEALEAWGEVQAEQRAEQGDLFGDEPEKLPVVAPIAADGTHRGRRPGARGKRTDELSRWYIAKNDGRDPLERGIEIAGLPILANGILEGLAERLGCTRHDAAKFWANILATTLPYTHQRQAAVEVRPPGAPGSGQPILWTLSDSGELIDATHDGSELRDIMPTTTDAEGRD
jgi:hypothetical protein